MRRRIAWAGCLLTLVPVLYGRASVQGPATLVGHLVDGVDGEGVADAVLTLNPASGPPHDYRGMSDAVGSFVIKDVPPGDYFLTAIKPGYLPSTYGPRSTDVLHGSVLSLLSGRQTDVAIVISRYSAIGGRVTADNGLPIVGVPVTALVAVHIGGQDSVAEGPTAMTDDRGSFEIVGLAAGDYRVMARIAAPPQSVTEADADRYVFAPPARVGGRAAYPDTFFPSATSVEDALPVHVDQGVAQGGVDISLRGAAAYGVQGSIRGAAAGQLLRLVRVGCEPIAVIAESAAAVILPDGSFVFPPVAAGTYHVLLSSGESAYRFSPSPALPRLWDAPSPTPGSTGDMSVQTAPVGTRLSFAVDDTVRSFVDETVTIDNGDLIGLTLQARSLAEIDGTIVWDGRPLASMRGAPVVASPLDGPMARPSVGRLDQGRFAISGLRPATYLITPPYGVMKSVICEGHDATRGIDLAESQRLTCLVTLSSSPASIEGTLQVRIGGTSTGPAGATHLILLFPVDRADGAPVGPRSAAWQMASADNLGRFRFPDLPSGDFYVVPVADKDVERRFEEGFLATLISRAERVHLEWGQKARVSLVLP